MTTLNRDELIRYGRHTAIPDIGLAGQEKLKAASVLMIGAGGLSCPMLQYLVSAGVGKIGIIDFDRIDISNLQRQILYDTEDIGRLKCEVAREKLTKLNPHVKIIAYPFKIERDNVLEIMLDYNFVADGSDNFPTRYLVNDACVLSNKTYVYGSVYRFEGQVSVFNRRRTDGTYGPNYRDIFPIPPQSGAVMNCAQSGVLGVLPGIIGCLQANEVIKLITGVGQPLDGKLFILDSRDLSSRIIRINKNPATHISELIDYDDFCNSPMNNDMKGVKEVTVSELKEWKDTGKDFQLIDVREKHEKEFCNIGGDLMPMGVILNQLDQISTDKDVVVYCRSGSRSAKVIKALQQMLGSNNFYNLKGGILAWSDEIDPSIPKY